MQSLAPMIIQLKIKTVKIIPVIALVILGSICSYQGARADVVKPALIEITANTAGHVEIELRASIEALLTGINARFKNTKQSPMAEAYDVLRVMTSDELDQKFHPFIPDLLRSIKLTGDGTRIKLYVKSIKIPETGYTKVPRISVIVLRGDLDRTTKSLQFYYPAKFGDSAVRVRQVDLSRQKWHWSEWQWIRKDEASRPFALDNLFYRRPILSTISEYISIGFAHIMPKGTDHILFVLGLFLFNARLRPLLWQVTMFTLAHTMTLGLSMAGLIELPARVVEPLIALSIAYVGIENIFMTELKPHRLVLVFTFGLLHGLGFASVLTDFGMPANAFLTALISFNVGVELGQISIITLAFLVVGVALNPWLKSAERYRSIVIIPGSIAIAIIGLYWTVERLQFF